MTDRLACEPGIALIGIANPEGNLVAEIETAVPDVVLLDTSPRDALAVAARLIRERPQTRILGFGVSDVPEDVVACAEAGLSGYVPCTASITDLIGAARRVASGYTVCSVAIADGLFRHLRGAALGSLPSSLERVLTQRQQQIVGLIGEGLSNKEIARRLSLGTSTVKNHVHDILDRLQVTSRSEAAARIHRPLHIS
ncbi:MAG TPA: response regulator transcription factor [Stellaceae bacterium]|nr:response regulator transcription factor [Stellaceae bacterium]